VLEKAFSMCDDAIALLFLTSVYTGLSSVPGKIKQILYLFLYLWFIFALLDPDSDPDPEP
jgi:hypothetical protein